MNCDRLRAMALRRGQNATTTLAALTILGGSLVGWSIRGQAAGSCVTDANGNVTCGGGTISTPLTIYDAAAGYQPVNGSNSYTPTTYSTSPPTVTVTINPDAIYGITTNLTSALADRGVIVANYSNAEDPAVNNVTVNVNGLVSITTAQISTSRMHAIVSDSQVNNFTVNVGNTGLVAATQNFFANSFSAGNLGVTYSTSAGTYSASYGGKALNVVTALYTDDNTNEFALINNGQVTASGNYTAAYFGRAETTITNNGAIVQNSWNPGDAISAGHWAIANYAGATFATVANSNPDTPLYAVADITTNGSGQAQGNLAVVATSMATITNNAGALIQGDILLVDSSPQVIAAGLASGNTAALPISGTNAGPLDSTVSNAGTINGNIYLGSGNHQLSNTGTINGSISVNQTASEGVFATGVAGTVAGTYQSAGPGTTDSTGNACPAAGSNSSDPYCAKTTNVLASYYGARSFSLYDAGPITGNITINDVASSNNTITLDSGSAVAGTISANGLGANALILQGSGTLGNVVGFSTLTMTGANWLLPAGTSQQFLAGSDLQAGQVTLNGVLTSDVMVENGAALAGTGQVVGTLTNAGTLAPGNATGLGTLTVNGAYVEQNGATLRISLTPAGQSGLLLVNGPATLASTLLLASAGAGTYLPNTRYTVLTATGGVSGAFSGASASFLPALLAPTVSSDGTHEYLTLRQLSFATGASPGNPTAVGLALDRAFANNPTVLVALDNQSATGLATALMHLSGEGYAGLQLAQLQGAQAFGDQIIGQDGDLAATEAPPGAQAGAARVMVAAIDPDAPVLASTPRSWALWAAGYGQLGQTDATAASSDVRTRVAGFVVGADRALQPGLRVGVAVGYGSSDVHVGNGDHGNSNAVHVAAYGFYHAGRAYLDGAIGGGYAGGNLTRDPSASGIAGAASGNTGAGLFLSSIEAGLRLQPEPGLFVTPFAGLKVAYSSAEALSETGAGPFPIHAGASSASSVRSVLGGRVQQTLPVGATKLTVDLKLGWAHEFADTTVSTTNDFLAAPGAGFTVSTPALSRERMVAGAGFSMPVAKNLSFFGHYEAEIGSNTTSQALRGGARYEF
jgi:outer membrane autotransporter protein